MDTVSVAHSWSRVDDMTDYGTNAIVRGHENESYAAVLDIPIMASPLYQMPQAVSLGNRLAIIPENLNNLLLYPFTLEEEVLEGIKEFKVLESARYEELERKYQQYVEDKIHRQKVAARKIAPGFLDTDTKILTPKPLNNTIPNGRDLDNLPLQNTEFSHNSSRHNRSLSAEIPLDRLTVSESSGVKPSTSISSGIGNKKPSNINYLEFEQGLAPLDPWDTPESDLDALHEIWQGGNSKSDYRRRTMTDTTGGVARGYTPYHAPPPSVQGHPQVRVYQPQQSLPLPQKQVPYSSSPHYPIGRPASGTSSPVPHQYPPKAASPAPAPAPAPAPPARPPKAFEKTSSGPPPPPPPVPAAHTENIHANDSNNGLIKELVDMGFSRDQAQVALEKNDNDISKATNFLLDSSE
ncbi:hypothetical protein INT43_002160 [Umbelopsis isabellina]|uniref:UBA domain-containing protein n=1 Tax=Mortierella isabellina TaxID=91625 RepID=A0A8H7Q551_MORIS|nr:hypothetical protein INT43_002160 [Umbelopsis isabellina]